MRKNIRYLGLDVHAATIAVAIVEGRNVVRSLGEIPNRPETVARLLKKLGDLSTLHVCYEAGPTGYVLYWQLTKLGVHCEVIAPSLVPVKAGDRVKTDRRDAESWRVRKPPTTTRHQPRLSNRQLALQRDLDPRVLEIAWKAQLRLSRQYTRLSSKSKPAGKVVTAVARELVGFIWAIGTAAESQHLHKTKKAA